MFAGGAVALAGYLLLILVPSWVSFGRLWERLAASFLTLFMLVTLVVLGVALGLAAVWSYNAFG